MKNLFSQRHSGQMAITMVISILLFLMLMFPVMDLFVQNEGKWSVKEKKSTTAFHLAEAGIDRARWKLLESDDMWIMTGTGTIAGYNFDQVYESTGSGYYTISITSHPTDADMRVVESVGKDRTGAQLRRIKAILRNDNAADFATRAAKAVTNGAGNAKVEWGPVMSGLSINAQNRTYPRFYSAGHVTPQDGGSTSASTDNVYWWSYYELPPMPDIKFASYLSSATAADTLLGGAPNKCGSLTGAKYHNSGTSLSFKGCIDTSGNTYYLDGENAVVTFEAGGVGNYIVGNIIVPNGTVIVKGGGGAKVDYTAAVPPKAWEEYGNAWSRYMDFDTTYAFYSQAKAADYTATGKTYYLEDVLFHGFVYAGKGFSLTGGGGARMHGVLLSNGMADIDSSTFDIFFDPEVAAGIMMQRVIIKLHSWYEVKAEWPVGL